jgi:predicted transcriptional regulator
VVTHLPAGKVRHLRLNSSPIVTDLGLRVFEAIARGWCKPTARAVAAHFDRCKDAANRALRSLERAGLLLRRRRSAGKNVWVHIAVVTDEHFAWHEDEKLVARIAEAEADAVARAREAEAEAEHVYPAVPTAPAVPASSQPGSCPTSQDVTDKEPSKHKKDLSGEPVDSRYQRKLMSLLRVPGRLEPHMFRAMELLHGLEVKSPMDRAFYGRYVAEFLSRGGALGAMTEFLTVGMETARSKPAVLKHRLERLRASLAPVQAARRG